MEAQSANGKAKLVVAQMEYGWPVGPLNDRLIRLLGRVVMPSTTGGSATGATVGNTELQLVPKRISP